jgi:hypothetical protein
MGTNARKREAVDPSITEYRLQKIPVDLWRQVKAEAARAGLTIREYVVKTLTEKLKREVR